MRVAVKEAVDPMLHRQWTSMQEARKTSSTPREESESNDTGKRTVNDEKRKG